MGLPYGTSAEFDIEFAAKRKVSVIQFGENVVIVGENAKVELLPIHGDCTAATLYSGECPTKYFMALVPILLEYLSCNGRINCFFSRKLLLANAEEEIALLRKYPIAGLNAQYSNRCSSTDYVMVSGIFKIPNPFVRYTYNNLGSTSVEESEKHNHFKMDVFNEVNQRFVGEDQ